MQYPSGWFVYVLPGFLYLTLIYLICPKFYRDKIREVIIRTPIGLVLAIIFAFIIGVVAKYFLIEVIRPRFVELGCMKAIVAPNDMTDLFLQKNNPLLDALIRDTYNAMLCLRSSFIPIVLLIPVSMCYLWFKYRTMAGYFFKIVITVAIFALTFIVYLEWREWDKSFNGLMDQKSEYLKSNMK